MTLSRSGEAEPPRVAPGEVPEAVRGAAASPSADERWCWDGRSWRPKLKSSPSAVPYRSAQGAAGWVIAAVAFVITGSAVSVLLVLVLPIGGIEITAGQPMMLDEAQSIAIFPFVVVGALSTVAYVLVLPVTLAAWAWRCSRNLPALGITNGRWTPVWAAMAWLIPIANLILPILVLRELWAKCSEDGRVTGLLRTWRAAWLYIASVQLVTLVFGLVLPPPWLASPPVQTGLILTLAAAGVLCLAVVQRLTNLQDAHWRAQPLPPAAAAVEQQPIPRWARAFASVEDRAGWSFASISIATLGAAVMLVVSLGVIIFTATPLSRAPISLVIAWAIGLLIASGGVLGGSVAIAMWTHHAYRNLGVMAVQGLQWSPRWAAVAWFIPVVNLCLPCLVLREIWKTSGGPKEPVLFAWWGAWIAGLLLGLLSQVTYLYSGPVLLFPLLGDLIGIVGNVALLIAGALAIVVIRSITTHQDLNAQQMAVAVPRYEIGGAASLGAPRG